MAYADFVRAMHPAPWRYTTEADFDRLLAKLDRAGARDDLARAAALQTLLASLHDSHIAVTTSAFQPAGPAQLLPIWLVEVEGVLVIDAAPDVALVGATLEAIDGVGVEQLRAALAPLVIADGTNPVARRRAFERDFVRLYALGFGLRARYRVRTSAGEVELPGADFAAIRALSMARRSSKILAGARDRPTLEAKLPGVTWLRLASFGSPDETGYAAAVDALLGPADRTRPLVIDVRGNEGGLRTHGIAVANHVLAAPYRQWQRLFVRAREVPAGVAVTGAFGTDLARLRAFRPAGDRFVIEGDPLAARMRPHHAWQGSVIVLVDGGTNSAANELVLALEAARPDVVLVGEEIGGACDRHVGEIPTQWSSPPVVVLMSLAEIEHVAVPGCRPGRGLVPDVAVTMTRADLDAARDPYVVAVAQLVAR